jgi:hypothetical protein
MGRCEENTEFGGLKRRNKNNVKLDIKKIVRKGVGRNRVTQDKARWRAVVDTVTKTQVNKWGWGIY